MAGHSHWAKIKRAKGANDAKRGKVWSKIARKIIIAAKAGGGNPADNLSLRYVIEEAKGCNMPKDTITNAIKKGTGELGAENYEDATYEAYFGGVAIMVEALTNNRARTVADLRFIFEKNGGSIGTSGSVAFQFTKQGLITIKAEGVDEDALMELALEAGAEDVRNETEVFEVVTTPTAFHKVKEAVAPKFTVEASEVTYVANNTIPVDVETGQKLLKLIDVLEDNDDVQKVSHNAEIPEAAMA